MRQKEKRSFNELKSFAPDFWDHIPEEIRQAIQKAKKQLDRGEGISHEMVMNAVRAKYLNK